MTKHDTWATVTDNCLLKEASNFFPQGQIPLRDPFPFPLKANGSITTELYLIDMERLEGYQYSNLRAIYNFHLKLSDEDLTECIRQNGGFSIHMNSIKEKFFGAESYNRMIEFLDFMEENPEPRKEQYIAFCHDQYNRWVIGDEEAMPLPQAFAEYDPRFRTPELEKALKQRQIEQQMAGYSVFDVLTGKAAVEILNNIDPENSYELVGLDEMLEDE